MKTITYDDTQWKLAPAELGFEAVQNIAADCMGQIYMEAIVRRVHEALIAVSPPAPSATEGDQAMTNPSIPTLKPCPNCCTPTTCIGDWQICAHCNCKWSESRRTPANPQDEEVSRRQFEDVIVSLASEPPSEKDRRRAFGLEESGEYVDAAFQLAWECWQAARADRRKAMTPDRSTIGS